MSIESRCTIGAMASKKASASSPVSAADRVGERRRGEGAGRDDDAVPVGRRQAARSPRGGSSISGWAVERGGDGCREAVAVDRQRAAGRHLVGVGRPHDQRAEPAHLLVQQADRIVLAGRRSGTSWSRRVRPAPRSCGPRSCAPGASRAARPGRRARRSARRLREPARPPPMMWTARVWYALVRSWRNVTSCGSIAADRPDRPVQICRAAKSESARSGRALSSGTSGGRSAVRRCPRPRAECPIG